MSDCPKISCCQPDSLDYSLQSYPLYTNEELTFFIPCPAGFSCAAPEYEVTIPAGTVTYRPTTSAENTPEAAAEVIEQRAREIAEQRAMPFLQPRVIVYHNASFVLGCENGQVGDMGAHPFFTSPGVVTIPPGVFAGPTQEAANALAISYAESLLALQGNCRWENVEVTVQCPDGGLGGPVVIPAGTYSSLISQEDADQQAINDAQAQIDSQTVCYWENTEQTVDCPSGETGGPFTIPAGTYQSFVSQADADALALQAAQDLADALCSGCTNHNIQDLSWTIVNIDPGNVATASGATGAGETLNGTISFEAHLQDSCNPYEMTINLPFTLRAPSIAGPGSPMRFVQVFIDDNLEASQTLPYPVAGCDTLAGTIVVNHMIEPDAYSTANGYHKIYIYAGQNVSGVPDSPTCKLEMTFSITPLTPP